VAGGPDAPAVAASPHAAGLASVVPAQAGSAEAVAVPGGGASARENLAAARKELNGLVTAWHHRTGQPHGVIHADLRRSCGGPPVPQATGTEIRARIVMLRKWAAERR
jgi:hypothetical protein